MGGFFVFTLLYVYFSFAPTWFSLTSDTLFPQPFYSSLDLALLIFFYSHSLPKSSHFFFLTILFFFFFLAFFLFFLPFPFFPFLCLCFD